MAERYERLFLSERNLYLKGSPVIIGAAALLKDNQTGNILAQIKYKNISLKEIKSIAVKIKMFDNVNRPVGDDVSYTYLDLYLKRDKEHGEKEPIVLPDKTARAINVVVTEVAFNDNTLWNNSEEKTESIKEQKLIDLLGNAQLAEQYKIETGTLGDFAPSETEDLWFCVCGAVNRNDEEKCHICKKELSLLKEKLDPEKLKINLEERLNNLKYNNAVSNLNTNSLKKIENALKDFNSLSDYRDSTEKAELCKKKIEELKAEEKIKQIEQEKQVEAAKLEAERISKRNKKITIISISTIAVLVAFIVLLNSFIIPTVKYNKAVSLMENEQIEEAFGIFTSLDDFKDSKEQSDKIRTEALEKYNERLSSEIPDLSSAKIGDHFIFGGTNKGETPIEWRILDRHYDKILVVSEYLLGAREYDEKDRPWKTCSLRSWLDYDFYEKSFNEKQKKIILKFEETEDYAFLLSEEEVRQYFSSYSARQARTRYGSKSLGWWLRDGKTVTENGSFAWEYSVNSLYVRPAMWISIK